jgi:predicted nucleic acid-binding protein
MKSTLIDAGPLIALFDKDDKYHLAIKKLLKSYKGKLITTLPVITEVTHLLSFNIKVQIDFLKWVERGGLDIFDLNINHFSRIIQLAEKYADVPMDFADGSMIIIAEDTGNKDIITIDSDYHIYKIKGKGFFNNLLQLFIK